MNYISLENHENTPLEDDNFQFNCFAITDAETLPHWHNHTEIIYLQRGACTVYINGTLFNAHEGDILLVIHGNLHSIIPQESAKYYALVLGDTLFDALMIDQHCDTTLRPFLSDSSQRPLHFTSKNDGYPILLSLLTTVITENSEKKEGYQLFIKMSICRFFAQILRFSPYLINSQAASHQQSNNTRIIKKALEYLSLHYKEKILLADLSFHFSLSIQHFCRLFKGYTGKTFSDFLSDLRLDHANRLLLETDLPITQIPELVGICNSNYFARIYKRKYGISPSKRRKG
ncbi:MAG: helix-turn-helix transcriptional regulator [Vallitaleaceae bacterium]|nr:helix-turn-helix transcriptional regulator [Vallitaleaceae bacterium]